MRISDWSSDVCSSDLFAPKPPESGVVGNRLSKIYTRTGDDGTTGLGDGSRVDKDSARVAAYGTVDELNSLIGVVLACAVPESVRTLLLGVQHQLFDLGGELCIPGHAAIRSEEHTSELQSLMRISYAVFCLKKKKK